MIERYKSGGEYVGDWVDGEKSGKWRYHATYLKCCRNFRQVELKFLCILGGGVYTYPSGDVYEGSFLHGMKESLLAVSYLIELCLFRKTTRQWYIYVCRWKGMQVTVASMLEICFNHLYFRYL